MTGALKKETQTVLVSAPVEYVFYLHGGGTLANLIDLANALHNISDDAYSYHVNDSKNDFSNWVRDIFKDEKLANDLNKAANKNQAARIVSDKVAALKKKSR